MKINKRRFNLAMMIHRFNLKQNDVDQYTTMNVQNG